jgi:hypothetical protein
MCRAFTTPPALMVAPMQLTTPPDWLQVKFPSVPGALSAADTKVVLAGRASRTATFWASSVPVFQTSMV